eukprot:Gb_34908 [translate_table: standard]
MKESMIRHKEKKEKYKLECIGKKMHVEEASTHVEPSSNQVPPVEDRLQREKSNMQMGKKKSVSLISCKVFALQVGGLTVVESCLLKPKVVQERPVRLRYQIVSVGYCISMSAEPSGESSLQGLKMSSVKVTPIPPIAGDSDSDSSSDNEDQDNVVSDDHARIIWTNLKETTEKIEDIVVVDRSFLHDDIIAAVSGPSGQTCTVFKVHLTIDLRTPGGEIKMYISSKKLRGIRGFAKGDYVLHGPWLGRVVEVVDNVTISFDDGFKCKITRVDPERLMPIPKNLLEDAQYPFHPVSNVEVGSVYIYWIAAANPCPISQSTTIPVDIQDPKQLKILSVFFGTCSKLTVHDGWVSHCKILRKRRAKCDKKFPKKEYVLEWALLVVSTKIKVGVLWQDDIKQEMDHFKMTVAKIEVHRYNVLLVEKIVSHYAQEWTNCEGAWHCWSAREKREKKLLKTLMFLEGCPKPLGCTVLLKGANDEGATLLELPFRSPITVALPDKQSSFNRAISTVLGFNIPVPGHTDGIYAHTAGGLTTSTATGPPLEYQWMSEETHKEVCFSCSEKD